MLLLLDLLNTDTDTIENVIFKNSIVFEIKGDINTVDEREE